MCFRECIHACVCTHVCAKTTFLVNSRVLSESSCVTRQSGRFGENVSWILNGGVGVTGEELGALG